MLAELVVVGGAVLIGAGLVMLREMRATRRKLRQADWLLTRAEAAIGEARRASITVSGLQLVDHLLGVVARDGEPDPDAAG